MPTLGYCRSAGMVFVASAVSLLLVAEWIGAGEAARLANALGVPAAAPLGGVDPDTFLANTSDLIRAHGFPVEEHTIETEDGFLVSGWRLPRPGLPPVFLKHGWTCQSAIFFSGDGGYLDENDVVQGGNNASIPFYLYATGKVDVWLVDDRQRPRPRHKIYEEDDARSWNWDDDDLVRYDIAAAVQYIVNVTGLPIAAFIGHSRGGSNGFAAFSGEYPEIDQNVDLFIALGATPAPNYTSAKNELPSRPMRSKKSNAGISCMRCGNIFRPEWPGCCGGFALDKNGYIGIPVPESPGLLSFGSDADSSLADNTPKSRLEIAELCAAAAEISIPILSEACVIFECAVGGCEDFGVKINGTRLPVFLAHWPAYETSHTAAFNKNGQDRNRSGLVPLVVPTALFYGKYDKLENPKAVKKAAEIIPPALLVSVEAFDYGHLGMVLSDGCGPAIGDAILAAIDKTRADSKRKSWT